ncbi:MAG: hypothetical protein KA444_07455, partial [Bacteroidia bacterium]|nr:hypothetical protein [Bacteroidia bacterium]
MKHTQLPSSNFFTNSPTGILALKNAHRQVLSAFFILFITLGVLLPNASSAQGHADHSLTIEKQISPELKDMLQHFDREIYFTQNVGQWPAHVLYKADFPMGQALVT